MIYPYLITVKFFGAYQKEDFKTWVSYPIEKKHTVIYTSASDSWK